MNDLDSMAVAFEEAKIAYSLGQVPIGASLIIDGKIFGGNSSSQIKYDDYFHHAENILVQRYSTEIKRAHKNGLPIEMFTTMEPCLMCLGTMAHNRITRIVYACPDPSAGSAHIASPTEWYSRRWPKIERGPFAEESRNLFVDYIKKHPEKWKNILPMFEKLKETFINQRYLDFSAD